jgi:glutathione S-transferase
MRSRRSHPSFAAGLMLDRTGIPYSRVDLPQWFHRGALRVLRFPGRTVPALVLDDVRPEPRRVPQDPERRAKVEELERWADGDLQQCSRRLVYWALPRHHEAVGSYLEGSRMLLRCARTTTSSR